MVEKEAEVEVEEAKQRCRNSLSGWALALAMVLTLDLAFGLAAAKAIERHCCSFPPGAMPSELLLLFEKKSGSRPFQITRDGI